MLTSGTIAAIILIPLGLIFLLIAIGLTVSACNAYEPEFHWMGAGFLALFGIPMLILPLIGLSLVGFSGDYMAYKPVSGQVQEIASRQIASGKAMETRYVFNIDGQPYGIDDTRAALVKPGDTVKLNCVKEFVWGSTNNGYACNWG
jgi:hypothetical protein